MHKKQLKCIKKCKYCSKILQISYLKKGILIFTRVYYIKKTTATYLYMFDLQLIMIFLKRVKKRVYFHFTMQKKSCPFGTALAILKFF